MGRALIGTTTFALGALGALAAAGCAASQATGAYVPPWETYEIYGGESAVAVVDDPTTVTAWSLERRSYEPLPAEVSGFAAAGDPVTAAPEAEKELGAVLLDPLAFGYEPGYRYDADYGSVAWIYKPPCAFAPEAALRFARGNSDVTIVLSFECNELAIYQDGAFVNREHFDHARWRVLAPLKRMLRADPHIQGLDE